MGFFSIILLSKQPRISFASLYKNPTLWCEGDCDLGYPPSFHQNIADRGDMSHGSKIAERGAHCITESGKWLDKILLHFFQNFQIDSTANLGNLVAPTIHWLTVWMKGSSSKRLQHTPCKQSHSIVNRHSMVEICMTNTYLCWTTYGFILDSQQLPGTSQQWNKQGMKLII